VAMEERDAFPRRNEIHRNLAVAFHEHDIFHDARSWPTVNVGEFTDEFVDAGASGRLPQSERSSPVPPATAARKPRRSTEAVNLWSMGLG
jgi:hypothetical protein